jgi:uncharacterized protein
MKNMQTTARRVVVPIAVAIALTLAVAAVVMAANRPVVFVTSPSAATVATSVSPQAGVFTTGDATVSLKPDLATVFASIESQQMTASSAQADLAAKAATLIARIKALGVADADLSTTGYWVGPVYAPDGQAVSGYRASEELQVKWHDVTTVGKALDAIVQEGGATQVSVGFSLADPKAAQAEARSQAIAEARAKAQAMASAAGVNLGPVVRVSDLSTTGQYPYPVPYASGAVAPSTQLPTGQVDVQVTVEVDFAIA